MPRSTKKPDKRAERLIAECERLDGLLAMMTSGLSAEERSSHRVAYSAKLRGMAVPDLERERGRLELDRRRRMSATTDSLLRSSGPGVVTRYLRGCGLEVFVQRMDLLEVALNGGTFPEPLTSRVIEMTEADDAELEMARPDRAAETVQSMRAIACAVCVQPPPEYLEDPDFDLADFEPHRLPRQFVMPGAACGEGQLPVYVPEHQPREDGWRGLTRDDLKALVKTAIDNGPGALASFRLRQEADLENALGDESDGEDGERDDGGDVPVGGDGPGQGSPPVRVVGGKRDGQGRRGASRVPKRKQGAAADAG